MDKIYPFKTALSILVFNLGFTFTLLAGSIEGNCKNPIDTIAVNQDHVRYTIAVNDSKSLVSLSNLEEGAFYTLWISSQEVNPDCAFNISIEDKKIEKNSEFQSSMKFKARGNTQTVFLQQSNCHQKNAFFADLSISKSRVEDSEMLNSMMGITTSGGFTAQQLIEDVLIGGGCFDISNVQPIGNTQGMGTFASGASSIILDEGVILASGNIGNSAGPNNTSSISTNFGDNSGDPDLNILATQPVIDAVGIEFDFTPVVNTIEFRYVFASDEYCDFVGSNFNDVFGFFISGPGFNGPYTGNAENIALVPGTGQEVAINTVNITDNSAYYNDNVPAGQAQTGGINNCTPGELNSPGISEANIEYDGFTTILTATASVQVCETYHIRMVVADVNDGIYDSAVFLEANSFNLGGDVSMDVDLPGLGSTGIAYEGCAGDGYIIFERPPDSNLSQPVDVYFTISSASTATNGSDYSNLPPFVTIPAGQTQFLLPLSIYEDFITEGTETLILELDNPCTCQDASIEIQISDVPPMIVSTQDVTFCNETSTNLFADVSGGVPGYTYFWSTGETTPSINIDAITGTQVFTVTATDLCGNQEMSTVTVTVEEEAFAVIEGFAEVCEGNPTGVLTINFSGSGPWDLTYLIDGVPQAPIIGITENPYFLVTSEPGVYTIGSLFVNGCPGVGDGSGIILPTIFNSFLTPTSVSCPENFDGSIDFIIAGGNPEYSYEWSNGAFTQNLDNLPPGDYTVTVTDMNGCTHVDSGEVLIPDSIVTNIEVLSGVNCTDTLSGSADLTVNGGTPGYSYLWDNGSTEEDPTNLSAGVHVVTVTDSLGCMTQDQVTILQDAVPPIAEAEVLGSLTCDQLIVSIDGTNSSGGDSLSFTWTDNTGTVISLDTITNVENTGTYTLVVTNLLNGCSDETSVTVDQDIAPPIPNATGGILNCNTTEIMLDASGSTGAGTLEYSWLDEDEMEVGTEVMLNVINPGTYTLIVTDDSNGCSESIEVNVDQEITPPTPEAIPSGILNCNETTISIDGSASSGSGMITYQWLFENGDSLGTDTQIEVTDSGTYTLIITDSQNGCTAEVNAIVEQDIEDPIPDAVVEGELTCIDEAVLLDGSGSSGASITYQWLNGVTEIGTDAEVEVETVGTYTLIITNTENGCTAETDVEVDGNTEPPNPDAVISGLLTCDVEMVTLDGSNSSGNGAITYQWINENGMVVSTDSIYDTEDTGTYTLVVMDEFNGCTAEIPITVDENIQEPIADAGDNGVLNCDDISAILNGENSSTGSNISYEWLNESEVVIGSEISVEVEESGMYTLIVTDEENGCTSTAEVLIEADANAPEVDAIVDGIINCENSFSIIDGSNSTGNGPITFQWLDENNDEISIEPTAEVDNPGVYTLIVTDTDNACVSQISVEVLEDIVAPEPDILNPDLLTCALETIELDASNSSASGNVLYQWQDSNGSNLGTDALLAVETPGLYTLIITNDANGCTELMTVEVDQNIETPNPDATVDGILTCAVLSLELDASNSTGQSTLEYEWFDASNISIGNDPSLEIETAGVYTVLITEDINGCTALATVEVNEDIQDPIAIGDVDGLLNCSVSSAFLNGNESSGANSLDYQWLDINGMPIASISEIEVEEQGMYILVVTDQVNGCTNETMVQVDANFDVPTPAASLDGILTCENLSVSLDGTASTSNGEITYQWLDQNNVPLGMDAILNVADIGTYTLIISDQESTCTDSITLEVLEDVIPPIANAGPQNTLTCDTETVNLNGGDSSTGNDISYQWTNAGGVTVSNEINAEVGEAGVYTLMVTNELNGCTATSTVMVVPDENLPTADAGIGGLLTCDDLEVTLSGMNSSTGNNFSYEWLDPDGVVIDNDLEIIVNDPGTYTLIVTDNNNACTTTSSVEVEQNVIAPQAIPGNSPTLTCDQTEVLLDGSESLSGLGSLTYEWFDNNGISIGTDSTVMVGMAGVYTLQVVSENGCEHTAEVEVFLDANVPIADPGSGGVLDCDISTITLGSSNSSTGNNISYQWINSNDEIVGTEQFLEVNMPDSYTLIVFNSDNNCETSAQAIITEDVVLPQVDVGAGGLLTCEETGILLGGTGTSIGTNFQYEWTDVNGDLISTDSVFITSNPGTFTLTVLNTENACSVAETILVDQNIETPIADAGNGGVLTCDVSEVSLDGSASTGENLIFQWYNELGVPLENEPQLVVGETGVYTLTITNTFNGCTASDEVEVIPDEDLPTAIAIEDGILNCTVTEVLIDAGNSSSVSGNISFEWSDPNNNFLSNDPDLMVGSPGVYTVVVTDTENGCTTSALVEVPQDIENPQAIAGENDTLTCLITQLALNGSANNGINFSYEWFDPNDNPISQVANVDVDVAGVYTLLVTNLENGCTATDEVEIIPDVNLPNAVTAPAEVLTCIVESVILDAAGSEEGSNISYQWEDSNSNVISELLQVEVTEPGVYTIVVTNSENSCIAQNTVTVEQDINDPSAIIDGVGPLELNCDINAVVLNGENSMPFPDLDFAWSTTNGNITTPINTFEIEVDQSGIYELLVTDQTNGCTDTYTYDVGENLTPPSLFIATPEIINCYNPQVNLIGVNTSGPGSFEYTWTAINGTGLVSTDDLEATVNAAGVYSLSIENTLNGCDASTEVTVLADLENPNASASVDGELDCVTESLQLNGTGSSIGTDFTYLWNGSGIINGMNTLSPTVNQAGNYTLLVTNIENGCSEIADVTVQENENVPNALDLDILPPPCPGDNASVEILNVVGGEGPYLYSIDGGENFYDVTLFNYLDPGAYDLVVQDVIGCEHEESIDIPPAIEINVEIEDLVDLDPDMVISLGDTIQLNAMVNTATTLAAVNWSPTESLSCNDCLNPNAFPSSTTTYYVTVENENGCVDIDQITLRVRKDRGIYIPNVFSPFNEDGVNDIFHIFSDMKSVKNVNTFKVFDRWGELIFEDFNFLPDDPAHGWDGRLRGEPMNPAVFVYWAEVEFIDGAVILFKGDVTLVR